MSLVLCCSKLGYVANFPKKALSILNVFDLKARSREVEGGNDNTHAITENYEDY